jgi:hypothetical protein
MPFPFFGCCALAVRCNRGVRWFDTATRDVAVLGNEVNPESPGERLRSRPARASAPVASAMVPWKITAGFDRHLEKCSLRSPDLLFGAIGVWTLATA